MPATKEVDLPPGVPVYSMGAFRASGQPDVAKFVAPQTILPTPPPNVNVTPAPSMLDQWTARAKAGIQSLLGANTVAPQPSSLAPVVTDRTAALEGQLDELAQRSSPPSPAYQTRIAQITADNQRPQ